MERINAEDGSSPEERPPNTRAGGAFLNIKELLNELGINYLSYRHLRAEGKMPPEIRFSKRLFRISRTDVDAWRQTAGGKP